MPFRCGGVFKAMLWSSGFGVFWWGAFVDWGLGAIERYYGISTTIPICAEQSCAGAQNLQLRSSCFVSRGLIGNSHFDPKDCHVSELRVVCESQKSISGARWVDGNPRNASELKAASARAIERKVEKSCFGVQG